METGSVDAHLVALANCPVFGSRSLEKLFAHFGSAEVIWKADEEEFKSIDIPETRLQSFFTFRKKTEPEHFALLLQKHQIRVLTKESIEYPPLLKTIFDPPFVLFAQGATLKGPFVSIVGSRRFTEYGSTVCALFSRELAKAGANIVSGLASGIDTIAHKNALTVQGSTVAVLGGGLLAKNGMDTERLAEKMAEANGTVISEFGVFAPFIKYHFPMRNRIIAGMSEVTLVVEAAQPSGSLITAKAALEAGREVFAVPGPITSITSKGTNDLIKDGAMVATSPEEILLALNLSGSGATKNAPTKTRVLPPLGKIPLQIYQLLEGTVQFADEITTKSGVSAQEVSRALTELEILGLIENTGGRRYKQT